MLFLVLFCFFFLVGFGCREVFLWFFFWCCWFVFVLCVSVLLFMDGGIFSGCVSRFPRLSLQYVWLPLRAPLPRFWPANSAMPTGSSIAEQGASPPHQNYWRQPNAPGTSTLLYATGSMLRSDSVVCCVSVPLSVSLSLSLSLFLSLRPSSHVSRSRPLEWSTDSVYAASHTTSKWSWETQVCFFLVEAHC